jgi:ABC-type taurine transport system ATPase subunit
MPAVLDEPFTAVPAPRRGRLLNLVLAAAETTQVVLLTSDAHIALWARAQAARNTLSLLEPTPEAAPAVLDA